MKKINEVVSKPVRPTKILQFGEGNFLRGFVDYMVDIANEKGLFDGSVALVKPIAFGSLDALRAQDCVYTVLLRGKQDGETCVEKRVVTSVSGAVDAIGEYAAFMAYAKSPELRFIVSNTTEAGIVYDESDDFALEPPKSYPGKLTKFLYERFVAFGGAKDKGLIILPVELIEKNGRKLRECCKKLAARWALPAEFSAWLDEACLFCSTLVDRIVTGYPGEEAAQLQREFGYEDNLIVAAEPFALWVIESAQPDVVAAELPLDKAGLPVVFTDNLQPYRERKVRILNGAHTSSVLAAYLAGLDTVGELMRDKTLRAFIEKAVYGELSPMVPLPADEVRRFADSVMERFENPFIRHNLLSIALNSVSKYRARVLPSVKDTLAKTGSLPELLCFSLAALAAFYCGKPNDKGTLTGVRGADSYEIIDDEAVLAFFGENAALPADALAKAFLARADFWGEDLNAVPGLCEKVAVGLASIRGNGMRAAVEQILK